MNLPEIPLMTCQQIDDSDVAWFRYDIAESYSSAEWFCQQITMETGRRTAIVNPRNDSIYDIYFDACGLSPDPKDWKENNRFNIPKL